MSSSGNHELERVLGFLRDTTALTCDQFLPIDEGFVVRTSSLPAVWSLNHVRLTRPVSIDRAVALADQHLGELPYRQIHIEHEQTGRALESAFRAAGWRTERDLTMVLRECPEPAAATDHVIEASEQRMLAMMRRWFLEGPPETDEDGLRQLVESARRENRARHDRTYAIPAADGTLAAIAKLRREGAVAQVEDVFTAPEARRRGHARAVLTHTLQQALASAPDLVFIIADDGGWPKQLYGQLGFRALARSWVFHAASPA